MVVLTIAVALALAGCYAPDVRDCTVTCGSATDCADGQACTNGYCVADGATPACGAMETPDAPVASTAIRITIKGHGRVTFGGVVACDSETAAMGTCTVTVPRHAIVHAQAIADADGSFRNWTSTICPVVSQSTCDFTPATPTLAFGAQFN